MVVELDPEGVVPLAAGSQTRYPASGSMELTVREPQMFRHIVVPSINTASGNESIVGWANSLHLDHPYMNLIRSLLPVGEMELEIHEPYRTLLNTFNDWFNWLNDMVTLQRREGRRGYYYGLRHSRPEVCWGSRTSVFQRVSVSDGPMSTRMKWAIT